MSRYVVSSPHPGFFNFSRCLLFPLKYRLPTALRTFPTPSSPCNSVVPVVNRARV